MSIKIKKPTARIPAWVFVLLVGVALAAAGWVIMDEPRMVEVMVAEAPVPAVARRAIDGVLVPEGTIESYPLAVVIENSIEAWPISGIVEANLVWEAPVEAGITRLLAIFADGSAVNEIGPVRSIRPYFIDWAEEVHALLAHVGGSPDALAEVPSRAVTDLNEFWNGGYFWRNGRARPHNVYTSIGRLQEALTAVAPLPTYESWNYKDDALRDERGATQEITVVFGNPTYTVQWTYDPENNEYARSQRGRPYRDVGGEIVIAKNVIVMETEVAILDEIGRRKIKTVGNGPVRVFRDGVEMTGEWRRGSRDERTKFYDATGAPIPLDAGITWIQVVPVMDVTIQ